MKKGSDSFPSISAAFLLFLQAINRLQAIRGFCDLLPSTDHRIKKVPLLLRLPVYPGQAITPTSAL